MVSHGNLHPGCFYNSGQVTVLLKPPGDRDDVSVFEKMQRRCRTPNTEAEQGGLVCISPGN